MSDFVLELAKARSIPRTPERGREWEAGWHRGTGACDGELNATANDEIDTASSSMRASKDGEKVGRQLKEDDGTQAAGGVASDRDSEFKAQAPERRAHEKRDEENMREALDAGGLPDSKREIPNQLMGPSIFLPMVDSVEEESKHVGAGEEGRGREIEQERVGCGGDGTKTASWRRSISRELDVSRKSHRGMEGDWEKRERGGEREGKHERSIKGRREHSDYDSARSISRERDMSRERVRERTRQKDREERDRETHLARERERVLQAARLEVLAKREREREREREMERLRERERESQRDRERESQRERERAREREREINLNLNLNRERERERERERDGNVGEYESRRSTRRRDSEDGTRFLNLEAISRERSGREEKSLRDSGDGERQEMRSARGRSQAEGGTEWFTPRSGSLLSPRSGLPSQRSNYAQGGREKWVPSPSQPERSEDYVLTGFVAKSSPVREIA